MTEAELLPCKVIPSLGPEALEAANFFEGLLYLIFALLAIGFIGGFALAVFLSSLPV